MKLQTLLEGVWVIKNLDGKERRFKDDQSPAAIEWKNSHTPKTQRQRDRELDALYKASLPKKPTIDEIYQKASNAIADTFPDGDPIDRLLSWMRRFDLDMTDLDKAFKKHEKKTYYQYLGNGWEDLAQDDFLDAYREYHKHGRISEKHSNFWYMTKDGPKLNDNPWLTRAEQEKRRKNLYD